MVTVGACSTDADPAAEFDGIQVTSNWTWMPDVTLVVQASATWTVMCGLTGWTVTGSRRAGRPSYDIDDDSRPAA